MTRRQRYLIRKLGLKPHPEGGFFRETYRSKSVLPCSQSPSGKLKRRSVATCIYFLLTQGTFSAFHRLRSDEIWHFYEGTPLYLYTLNSRSGYRRITMGTGAGRLISPQAEIPAGTWFGAELAPRGDYALLGCTVAPGFDYEDFELASGASLAKKFPLHTSLIRRLTRDAGGVSSGGKDSE